MKRVYQGGNYRVLSDAEINRIHEASMQVFERVGFEIPYKPALDLLEKHGAEVNRETNRVKLPRELVSRSQAVT